MKNPFKRTFTWSVGNNRGEHFQGSGNALIIPFHGVPVYVPAGRARELRKCKKLTKRSARLAEQLSDALLELHQLEEFNLQKTVAMSPEKVPPDEAAPDTHNG